MESRKKRYSDTPSTPTSPRMLRFEENGTLFHDAYQPLSSASALHHAGTPNSPTSHSIQPTTSTPTTSKQLIPRLTKPIIIPSVRASPTAAFVRAYPPILACYGIPKSQFLVYLDRLNEAKVGVTPLHVLGEVSGLLEIVPVAEMQFTSIGIEVAANVNHYALGGTRVEILMHKLNQQVFEPRGLRMDMAKFNAVAKMANVKYLSTDDKKLDEKAPVLKPVQQVGQPSKQSTHQQRIEALGPWIERLEHVALPSIEDENKSKRKKLESSGVDLVQHEYEREMKSSWANAATEYQKEILRVQNDLDDELSRLQTRENRARAEYTSNPIRQDERLRDFNQVRAEVFEDIDKESISARRDWQRGGEKQASLNGMLFLTIRNLDAKELSPLTTG